MPRITPIHWKILECIFKKDGFSFDRQVGDHRCYVKAKIPRAIVIPTYSEVDVKIIRSNMRTAGMTRSKYFKFLKECK